MVRRVRRFESVRGLCEAPHTRGFFFANYSAFAPDDRLWSSFWSSQIFDVGRNRQKTGTDGSARMFRRRPGRGTFVSGNPALSITAYRETWMRKAAAMHAQTVADAFGLGRATSLTDPV